jgi:hypothetical protein
MQTVYEPPKSDLVVRGNQNESEDSAGRIMELLSYWPAESVALALEVP